MKSCISKAPLATSSKIQGGGETAKYFAPDKHVCHRASRTVLMRALVLGLDIGLVERPTTCGFSDTRSSERFLPLT